MNFCLSISCWTSVHDSLIAWMSFGQAGWFTLVYQLCPYLKRICREQWFKTAFWNYLSDGFYRQVKQISGAHNITDKNMPSKQKKRKQTVRGLAPSVVRVLSWSQFKVISWKLKFKVLKVFFFFSGSLNKLRYPFQGIWTVDNEILEERNEQI